MFNIIAIEYIPEREIKNELQECTLNKLNSVWFFVRALHLFKLLLIIRNN